MMTQAAPLLISVAPNGARRTQADHRALPIAPAELAAEAEACRRVGAGLLHLHVRDEYGRHSLAPDHYRAAMEAITDRLEGPMILQITTEACGVFDIEAQIACVRQLVPPAASFAVREFCPGGDVGDTVRRFFRWVADRGVQPQFIVYAPDEVDQLHRLIDQNDLPFASPPVLFVLGRYNDGPGSDPRGIAAFADRWRNRGHWSVCAFGPAERAVAIAAIALGGHVRVGFENNLWAPDGALLESTAEQADSIAQVARLLVRPLSTRFE